jgi:hypothetical protein
MRKTVFVLALLCIAVFTGGIAGAQAPSGPRLVTSEAASGPFVHDAPDSVSHHGDPGHLVAQTDRHGNAPEKRGRHKHRGRDTEPPPNNGSTGEGDSGGGATEATGADLAIALGLAAALGAGGGILLRFSALG